MCWPSFQAFQDEKVEGVFSTCGSSSKLCPEWNRHLWALVGEGWSVTAQQSWHWKSYRSCRNQPECWDEQSNNMGWLKSKGQIKWNYLHRSIWKCSEHGKASFSISRDTMHQLKCPIWLLRWTNRKLWMQGQGMGSPDVPWAQLSQGQSGGWRGSKDRGGRSQSNPLKCDFQHQSWGFSKRQSPQWHCGRHGVQDTQLSQSLGLSKPLFVTRFTLGAGLRKVENSCLNCKALLKIMQHSRLKIDLCWLQTSGWICLSPSNDFSVK